MLFKNSQDDWQIDLNNYRGRDGVLLDVTDIGVKISGGADSAIVAYMLALYVKTHRPDIRIHPVTAIAQTKPFQHLFAAQILAKITQLTGVVFATHQCQEIRSDTVENYIGDQEAYFATLDHLYQLRFAGLTANPDPKDAPLLYDGTHTLPGSHGAKDLDRTKTLVKKDNTKRPLINVDKQGVAEHYTTLGVLEEIFPLTRSCEEDNVYSFEAHCGDCWFCRERAWGFGGRLV